jgi:hypothetical protein
LNGREDEEEDVSSHWMTVRKREGKKVNFTPKQG